MEVLDASLSNDLDVLRFLPWSIGWNGFARHLIWFTSRDKYLLIGERQESVSADCLILAALFLEPGCKRFSVLCSPLISHSRRTVFKLSISASGNNRQCSCEERRTGPPRCVTVFTYRFPTGQGLQSLVRFYLFLMLLMSCCAAALCNCIANSLQVLQHPGRVCFSSAQRENKEGLGKARSHTALSK